MSAKELKEGQVLIHGRVYDTVALRVKNFREKHPDWTVQTEILHRDKECVVLRAAISDDKGRLVATGHSEEYRDASTINETSALENAETSAIGRALAAFGMGGSEFATADEVKNALEQQRRNSASAVNHEAFEALSPARKNVIVDTATQIKDCLKEDRDFDAFSLYETIDDQEEKMALWSRLDSKERSRIKKQGQMSKQKAA